MDGVIIFYKISCLIECLIFTERKLLSLISLSQEFSLNKIKKLCILSFPRGNWIFNNCILWIKVNLRRYAPKQNKKVLEFKSLYIHLLVNYLNRCHIYSVLKFCIWDNLVVFYHLNERLKTYFTLALFHQAILVEYVF